MSPNKSTEIIKTATHSVLMGLQGFQRKQAFVSQACCWTDVNFPRQASTCVCSERQTRLILVWNSSRCNKSLHGNKTAKPYATSQRDPTWWARSFCKDSTFTGKRRKTRLTGAVLKYGDVLRLDLWDWRQTELMKGKRGRNERRVTDRRSPLMTSTQQRQLTTSNRVIMQIRS